jgi:hypothetical protein
MARALRQVKRSAIPGIPSLRHLNGPKESFRTLALAALSDVTRGQGLIATSLFVASKWARK